jgi:hypothetical protein
VNESEVIERAEALPDLLPKPEIEQMSRNFMITKTLVLYMTQKSS